MDELFFKIIILEKKKFFLLVVIDMSIFLFVYEWKDIEYFNGIISCVNGEEIMR